MTERSFTEHEYRMAMAIASHPGLVAYDDLAWYSLRGEEVDSGSGSLWESSWSTSGSVELVQADDFDESTAQVYVAQIELLSEDKARARGNPIRPRPKSELRIISSRATNVMPSANTIMVNAFPLTRELCLAALRSFLSASEYATMTNEFLWGTEIVRIREE